MAYDFTAAIAAADAAVNQRTNANGEGKSYLYPLVYPQSGHTIVFRPLFNPASGQILRLVNRHEKVPCLRSYNVECPICKVMNQVKDMTGQDPFGRTKSSRARGVCFAQYISSTNPIAKADGTNIVSGDIIVMMFPWSVYNTINTMIQAVAQSPTGMDQAFCHAQQGLFIQINVSPDFQYTTTNIPYMTIPTNMTDEMFLNMLDKMESLNEQVIPSSITADVDKQVKEYEDAIYRQYIAPRVPNIGASNVAPQTFSQVPVAPIQQQINVNNQQPMQQPAASVAPWESAPQQPVFTGTPDIAYGAPTPQTRTPAQMTIPMVQPQPQAQPVYQAAPVNNVPQNTNPTCFGKHVNMAPQCLVCPVELQCMQSTT